MVPKARHTREGTRTGTRVQKLHAVSCLPLLVRVATMRTAIHMHACFHSEDWIKAISSRGISCSHMNYRELCLVYKRVHWIGARYSSTFVGTYATTRRALDYTWHTHYPPSRQLMQDGIISGFISAGFCQPFPWLVYTAGAMGAGKSWMMRHFFQHRVFPLDQFVVVDPDKIRAQLPEISHYTKYHHAEAGQLTQKEAGYLAEIVQREAMQRGKNVLVDGSLRNAHWYEREFRELRTAFPSYRICIIMVEAPPDVIHQRAERRGQITGRTVPRAIIDETIHQVPRSYSVLAPLADYTVVVHNDADKAAPTFEPPTTLESFRAIWASMYGHSDAA
jgi:predicted kinase